MGRLNKRQSKKQFKKMIYKITGKKLKVPRSIFKGGFNTIIGLPLYMAMVIVPIAAQRTQHEIKNINKILKK